MDLKKWQSRVLTQVRPGPYRMLLLKVLEEAGAGFTKIDSDFRAEVFCDAGLGAEEVRCLLVEAEQQGFLRLYESKLAPWSMAVELLD